jgi:hypothetical protein
MTHRPPRLDISCRVRKAIGETPAETDSRDAEPCRHGGPHSTFSRVPRLEHGSYGVVQAPMLIDCATPADNSSMGRLRAFFITACRRWNWQGPAEHAVGSTYNNSRSQSSGPISAVHLCLGPPLAPGATDISGGPPRRDAINPGAMEPRSTRRGSAHGNLQKNKECCFSWLGS